MLGIPHRYLTSDLPGTSGTIKNSVADFVVEEIPLYPPCGEGEHVYFEVEKTDLSTLEALERLARKLGRRVSDFGYAGLKDRRGITRQTFSISGHSPADLLALNVEQLRILRAERHSNKLRIGHLRGNRFGIRVCGVVPEASARAQAVLDVIAREGLPNFYGPQRFGSRADAHWIGKSFLTRDDRAAIRRIVGCPSEIERDPRVVSARYLFLQYRWAESSERFPVSFREERRILAYLLRAGENYAGARKAVRAQVLRLFLAAYQSYLFNVCLDRRLDLTQGQLGRFFSGDVAYLHRNGALFRCDDVAPLEARAAAFEISPSGPIFGKKMMRPAGIEAEIEADVLRREAVELTDFHYLEQQYKLEGGRRPFRVPVADLEWRQEGSDLVLSFLLPKGVYATTLLREITKNEEMPPGFYGPPVPVP